MKDAEPPRHHSGRVIAGTIVIARKTGLPKEETSVIARGGYLHDIGEMVFPVDVLLKPGKRTDDEMAVVREHWGFDFSRGDCSSKSAA